MKITIEADNKSFVPKYATEGAAGADLVAAIAMPMWILKGERLLIPTGIKIAIPDGYEAQVRPRSGLALKHGITVLNSPGTIDSDYRKEIGVILINHSDTDFLINPGDRIAQLVIAPVVQAQFEIGGVDKNDRGGFGSTGVKS